MGDDRASLERLRREIDQIDDELHDLLMRRTLIVRSVAAAKALDSGADDQAPHGVQALAMRPGREAGVIRRLLGRHEGELPGLVVTKLWRELMTAKTRLQAPLTVCVFTGEDAIGYWDLARFYYGSPTPLQGIKDAGQVLEKVKENTTMIGVVPVPDGNKHLWWQALSGVSEGPVNIIGKLPFVRGGEQPLDLPEAFVVAPIDPEETGDDTTLIAIESDTAPSGDNIRLLAGEGTRWLVEMEGFLTSDSPELSAIKNEVQSLKVIGTYANPIDLDRLGSEGSSK